MTLDESSPPQLGRKAVQIAPWVAVLGLVLGPAAALGLLALQGDDIPAELKIPPVPVISEPTRRVDEGRINAVAELEIGGAPAVVAPEWAGVVTSVNVANGDVIKTGDPLLSVKGVLRLAAATDVPFHRDLSVGAKGNDVLALESLLASLGLLLDEPDDVFRSSTSEATKGLESAAGIDRPTGVFSASLVVWIPTESVAIEDVLVATGSPAPGAGSAIFTTRPKVLSVRFSRGDGSVLAFEGRRLIEVEGEPVGTITEDAPASDSTALALWELSRSMGSDGAGEGFPTIPVTLRYPEPVVVWSIPSSAVMVDEAGRSTCVWVDDAGTFDPLPVTPIGGTLGVTDLRESLAETRVLINPIEVLPDPSCP